MGRRDAPFQYGIIWLIFSRNGAEEVDVAGTFARHLALIGFATVCLQGLLSNSPFVSCLKSALMVTLLFGPLGWILGELARWLVEDQVHQEIQRQRQSAANAPQNTPT